MQGKQHLWILTCTLPISPQCGHGAMAREILTLSPDQIVNLSSRGGSATYLESGGLWRPSHPRPA